MRARSASIFARMCWNMRASFQHAGKLCEHFCPHVLEHAGKPTGEAASSPKHQALYKADPQLLALPELLLPQLDRLVGALGTLAHVPPRLDRLRLEELARQRTGTLPLANLLGTLALAKLLRRLQLHCHAKLLRRLQLHCHAKLLRRLHELRTARALRSAAACGFGSRAASGCSWGAPWEEWEADAWT